MDGESGLFQRGKVPLDRPGCNLEIPAQPDAGDPVFVQENPEDLSEADQPFLHVLFAH